MPLQKLVNALLAPATVESQSLDTPMVLSWYDRNATAMAQFNLHNQSLPRTQRKWTRLVVRQIWMFRHAGGLTTVCMGRLHSVRKRPMQRSEEHTSELQSLLRSSYAFFCLKKTK